MTLFLPGIPFPDTLQPTSDLDAALSGVAETLVVVPSHAFAAVVRAAGAWRFRSWDGFMVPRPFTSIEIEYLPPVEVPRDADRAQARGRR